MTAVASGTIPIQPIQLTPLDEKPNPVAKARR